MSVTKMIIISIYLSIYRPGRFRLPSLLPVLPFHHIGLCRHLDSSTDSRLTSKPFVDWYCLLLRRNFYSFLCSGMILSVVVFFFLVLHSLLLHTHVLASSSHWRTSPLQKRETGKNACTKDTEDTKKKQREIKWVGDHLGWQTASSTCTPPYTWIYEDSKQVAEKITVDISLSIYICLYMKRSCTYLRMRSSVDIHTYIHT